MCNYEVIKAIISINWVFQQTLYFSYSVKKLVQFMLLSNFKQFGQSAKAN